MQAATGERIYYCPADMHLVSAVLSAATGKSAAEFARQNLFAPLGITQFTWASDPQGISLGWRGLELDPADTARLGYLYLNNGQWGGQQVLPQAWVEAALHPQGPNYDQVSVG
jgi:CubicO group peptidase (beta-lactamase class C family)